MEFDFSTQAILGALMIFGLRVSDMSLDTLRVLFVIRGRKGLAWILGFCQATIFIVAITSVLSNLDNALNVIGYGAGYATGIVVGILIEERLAIGNIHVQIISPRYGPAIAERLREEGYAVTEVPARGKDGTVTLLSCHVRRRHVPRIEKMVYEIDAKSFITAADIRSFRRGFWRA